MFVLDDIIKELVKDLDANTRKWLLLIFTLCFLSIPVSLITIAISFRSVSFKNQSTEINLRSRRDVDRLTNDAEYTNKQTDNSLGELDLKVQKLGQQRPRDPLVNEVVREFKEFKPTAQEQLKRSEEVTELLESAIAK